MTAPAVTQPNEVLRSHMSSAVQAAGLSDTEAEIPLGGSARKRARFDPRAGSRLATVSLVEDEEVLRWVYDPPPASPRRRARRAGLGMDEQEVILGFQFLEVPPNEVIARLEALDLSMTPARGLRRWIKGQPAAVPKTPPKGRVLLLVHGTFSRGDMYFEEFAATEEGQRFLSNCEKKYEIVLTFDHPTLAMSPWLNGLDLARVMAPYPGPIDVICHSRGGLAVAWWLYVARPKVDNVVFAGSPLEGTSLAAPAKLKAALDLLGNLARAIGTMGNAAATAVPMLAFAGGLMKIVGGALSVGARSPLIDAGIAIVPGLAAQSRVGNNFELQRLFAEDWPGRHRLHAIASNYEPAAATDPWWRFWKHFRDVPGRALNWGADAIFQGDNDLVVDTASMSRLGKASVLKAQRLQFDGDQAVHHCSYFRQPRTFEFLETVLKL